MKKLLNSIQDMLKRHITEYKEARLELAWVWKELTTPQGKRWALIFVGLSALVLLVFTLQPLVFSWLINALNNDEFQVILTAFAALVSLAIFQQGVTLFYHLSREWLWNRNMLQIHDRLNELFYEKTLGQHLEEGSELNFENIEKSKNRIDYLQMMILFEAVKIVLTILLSLVFLWFISWEAAAIITSLLMIHGMWSLYLNYRVAIDTTPIEKDFRAENRQMVERWEKIARVKTSGKSREEHERLSSFYDDILDRDRKFWFWYNRQTMYRELIGNVFRIGVIGYGIYLVYSGYQEIGFLVPLYAWVTEIVQNLWYLGHAERRINEQIPYIRSLRKALTKDPHFPEDGGVEITTHKPIAVTFKNVSLHYGGNGTENDSVHTLKNISFSISPGERVALIGPSGAGKSSIMKLLLRFMDPSEGEIWVNDHRLTEVSLRSWLEHVGYIPQNPQVFDGTMRYNLIFGLPEEEQATITDEDIWEVMKLLRIDFGDRLIDGLDTVVGKNGMKLSGGEQQRLIVGAAVIKKPIFMVIDEATSSLDSTTEKAVQKGLETALSGPSGALIVTHRLSTVRNICDRFIVLRALGDTPSHESQIEAVAKSFEELYRISPTFRQLADDQDIVI